MNSIATFLEIFAEVKKTDHWANLIDTVEDSPYHREANTAVHTEMAINHYIKTFSHIRSERQNMLTVLALLFHDMGKPESEETLKRDTGETYRRYAGHELVSANEFISLICEHSTIIAKINQAGLDWTDVRAIKFMIEHHLPYGLKNAAKLSNLRTALVATLEDDVVCFFDMLRSDAAGRVSDDHEQKLASVEAWIKSFEAIQPAPAQKKGHGKTMYMLVGISGSGKSTFAKSIGEVAETFSEDDLRVEYAQLKNPQVDWSAMSEKERYSKAWDFCHRGPDTGYAQFSQAAFKRVLAKNGDFILDRMNHARKGRAPWIEAARRAGYKIVSVEFMAAEKLLRERQVTRGDKELPASVVHNLYFQQQVPLLGVEVDEAYVKVAHP